LPFTGGAGEFESSDLEGERADGGFESSSAVVEEAEMSSFLQIQCR
jgi:hypothetical protein